MPPPLTSAYAPERRDGGYVPDADKKPFTAGEPAFGSRAETSPDGRQDDGDHLVIGTTRPPPRRAPRPSG
jgi:hypothetical protein